MPVLTQFMKFPCKGDSGMYFLILFAGVWLWFIWIADKSRVREFYGAVVYTSFLGLATDLIMVEYKLWSYVGLPHPLYTIPLTLDFGMYPVVAYLFLQHLPSTWGAIFIRALLWTAPALLFEWFTLRIGAMHHHQWWRLWMSMIADIFIYLSIAGVFRYYRPAFMDLHAKETPSR